MILGYSIFPTFSRDENLSAMDDTCQDIFELSISSWESWRARDYVFGSFCSCFSTADRIRRQSRILGTFCRTLFLRVPFLTQTPTWHLLMDNLPRRDPIPRAERSTDFCSSSSKSEHFHDDTHHTKPSLVVVIILQILLFSSFHWSIKVNARST